MMKLLRSITNRGFNVGRAGWFTVLQPNPWFPASRQPATFRYHVGPSAETTEGAERRLPMNPPQILAAATDDRSVIRPALIVLAATMVTTGLLWWICVPS
jgi:hypothetical protein